MGCSGSKGSPLPGHRASAAAAAATATAAAQSQPKEPTPTPTTVSGKPSNVRGAMRTMNSGSAPPTESERESDQQSAASWHPAPGNTERYQATGDSYASSDAVRSFRDAPAMAINHFSTKKPVVDTPRGLPGALPSGTFPEGASERRDSLLGNMDGARVNAVQAVAVIVVGANREGEEQETLSRLASTFASGLLPRGSFVACVDTEPPPRAISWPFPVAHSVPLRQDVEASQEDYENWLKELLSRADPERRDGDAAAGEMADYEFRRHLFVFCGASPLIDDQAFVSACKALESIWTRVVFAPVPDTWKEASDSIAVRVFGQEKVYCFDPLAASNATNRVLALRFGNRILEPTWNRNHVRAVLIDFADPSTSPSLNIQRVVSDHLLELVALVAMERPASRFGEDVRDAKHAALSDLRPVHASKICLARHDAAKEDVTFITSVFDIDSNRWRGVPFVVRAGKGMQGRYTQIRVLYWRAAGADAMWSDQGDALKQNELVIRVQPWSYTSLDLIRKDVNSNLDAMRLSMVNTSLDFSSGEIAIPLRTPEAFERLIHEVCRGERGGVPRFDSLIKCRQTTKELLHSGSKKLATYPMSSQTGPLASDDIIVHHVGEQCPWVSSRVGPRRNPVETAWKATTDTSLLKRAEFGLSISLDTMQVTVRRFLDEMDAGLASEENASSLAMIPTFVTHLPDGNETGVYYAIDLGGTNLRVQRFLLAGEGKPAVATNEIKSRIPAALCGPRSTSEQLFGFIADQVQLLIRAQPPDGADGAAQAVIGFTFSFPVHQTGLARGSLLKWTKGFETAGVVGQDVVLALERALEARRISARVLALANDTVGTLAALSGADPSARIGLILGTGTNAAYLERIDKIKKLPASFREENEDVSHMVVNIEWGNFGSSPSSKGALPGRSRVDEMLDADSTNPGSQFLEKMIAGYYLGEICRRILLFLYRNGEIWAGVEEKHLEGAKILTPYALDAKFLSDVEADLSPDLRLVRGVEADALRTPHGGLAGRASSLLDRRVLQTVARIVVERAAKITACALCAVVRRVTNETNSGGGSQSPSVAVDGTLFEAHPSFRKRLERALESLGCSCSLVLTKDGSGAGAAWIAAAAATTTTP